MPSEIVKCPKCEADISNTQECPFCDDKTEEIT